MTQNDLYWFFSTVAQSLGAIVGVVGMLTVFRLQNLENYIKGIMDRSLEIRLMLFGDIIVNQKTEDFIEQITKIGIGLKKNDTYRDGDRIFKKVGKGFNVMVLYHGSKKIEERYKIDSLQKTNLLKSVNDVKKIIITRNEAKRGFIIYLIYNLLVILMSLYGLMNTKALEDIGDKIYFGCYPLLFSVALITIIQCLILLSVLGDWKTKFSDIIEF